MAVTLRKLLECVEEEKIQILAGKNNLDRAVRWTHMVESIEISTFWKVRKSHLLQEQR